MTFDNLHILMYNSRGGRDGGDKKNVYFIKNNIYHITLADALLKDMSYQYNNKMETNIIEKKWSCDRCGHKISSKQNLVAHLSAKSACSTLFSSIGRDEYIKQLTHKPLTDKSKVCDKCNKVISKSGMARHRKSCKGINDDMSVIKNELEDLRTQVLTIQTAHQRSLEELDTLKKQLTYNTTNIQNNNINQNITININTFGNENTSYLTPEFLSYCLLNPRKGMTSLIENIHYNKDYPENQNLRCKSLKQNVFEKYVDSKWRACDASNTLDELIRKGYRILNAHYTDNFLNDPEIFEDEIKQQAYERFRFLTDTNCNDYFAVKREVRLLVKDRTMYLIASPEDTESIDNNIEK